MNTILTLSAKFVENDPSTILAYVLRHFFGTPLNAVTTYVEDVASLREIISRYWPDKSVVRSQVISKLTSVFNNIFPNNDFITIEVSIDNLDEISSTVTTIRIRPVVQINGQMYTITRSADVDDKGRLTFDYSLNA